MRIGTTVNAALMLAVAFSAARSFAMRLASNVMRFLFASVAVYASPWGSR